MTDSSTSLSPADHSAPETAQMQTADATPHREVIVADAARVAALLAGVPADQVTAAAPAAPAPVTVTFASFNLPPALSTALARMNYTTPTPIQAAAVPPALEGKDILGSAQTGTGKTAAFGIPLIARLLGNPRGTALIMTPTRELATQVMTVLKQMLGERSTINSALLIGGESMGPQFQQLRNRPRLIVGTPGRINDHLERGTLMLHDAGFLVLDETDRMLDMGFSIQLEKICKFLPKNRQTLLFSATLPANILKLSEKYLTNPVRVSAGETSRVAANIKLEVVQVQESGKYEMLLKEISEREGSIIIFVKTKHGADRMSQRLNKERLNSEAIHGDLKQSRRDRVIAAFREKKHRILVATDVAARGLDIPHIEHVINYDLPHAPEDYIHRIGRTARAGAQGSAISLVSPDDRGKWRAIQRLLDPEAKDEPRGDRGPNDRGPNGRSESGRNQGGRGERTGDAPRKRRPFRDRRPGGTTAKAA